MKDAKVSKRKLEGEEYATKKVKVLKDIPEDVIHAVWSHYRSFLESEEETDEENEPDFDELHEIISLLDQFVDPAIEEVSIQSLTSSKSSMSLPNVDSLLPVLLSMVYLHLGDDAISGGFQEEDQENNTEQLLHKSLKYFPMNAASLSMLANYQKMNLGASLVDICATYKLAAANAKDVRDFALSISVEHNDDADADTLESENLYTEWVELLLLNGVAGVEFIGEDDDDDDEEEEDVGEVAGEIKDTSSAIDAENGEQEFLDEYSTSQVEATSCFMAALLQSTLKIHNDALDYLAKFDFTHRIHPNVWLAATNASLEKGQSGKSNVSSEDELPFEPKSFAGALPPILYKKLCKVFSPSAAFWRESDYQNRGYYSFFEDINEESKGNKPRNLIDNVVVNHLLPLAQSAAQSEKIVGYEWWTHTRPLQANLGHQLHFDTDEALLGQEQKATHPIVSSVLYLTGNESQEQKTAGATIVFNQSPDSTNVASKAYISHAQDKKYMIFPGNCLHGVLPCSGNVGADSERSEEIPAERLTLMVGFWTRRVPDKMKNRHLYGPCGPLPDANDDNTWVSEIEQEGGCNSEHSKPSNGERTNITSEILPKVTPAWEDITACVEKSKGPKLEIPTSLDHRFFVKDASSCFRQSLFKKDEESFGN
jgi:hypothetical protein